MRTAQKLLKEAESSDNNKDEERAYVLYMRFFSAVSVSFPLATTLLVLLYAVAYFFLGVLIL